MQYAPTLDYILFNWVDAIGWMQLGKCNWVYAIGRVQYAPTLDYIFNWAYAMGRMQLGICNRADAIRPNNTKSINLDSFKID
jgi:hypothetical protein